MRDWIVIGVLYLVGAGVFSLLGGVGSAADALRRWGEASSVLRSRAGSSS